MGLTIAVVAGFITALIVYDIWTGVKRGTDTTISVVCFEFAKRYPIFPFAIGVILGHIFWVQQ